MRLTALAVARISSTAHTPQKNRPSSSPGLSKRVKETLVWMEVNSVISTAKAMLTASRPTILARLLRPRLRLAFTLIQSSSRPTRPAPTMAPMAMMPLRV